MYRGFFPDVYVGAKTDPMKFNFNHDPRQAAKFVSGAADRKSASAPQQLCSALNQVSLRKP